MSEDQGRSKDEFDAAKELLESIYRRRKATGVQPLRRKLFEDYRDNEPRAVVRFEDPQEELTLAAIRLRRKNLTVTLRKKVAYSAIIFVSVQLLFSNIFFGSYIYANLHELDPTVLIAWLSATVIEVIGILGIVTLSLFPNKNDKQKKPRV